MNPRPPTTTPMINGQLTLGDDSTFFEGGGEGGGVGGVTTLSLKEYD
jgi:hypothetical protein